MFICNTMVACDNFWYSDRALSAVKSIKCMC